MAFEKTWLQVGPQVFIVDGNANGTVIISSTSGFKVKQTVKITAIGETTLTLEVKRVLSPTTLLVGPRDKDFNTRTDLTNYTLAKFSSISAEEQRKSTPVLNDREAAIYEQEPTVAKRVIQVDEWGRFYNNNNPISVNPVVDNSISESYTGLIISNITVVNISHTSGNNIRFFFLECPSTRDPDLPNGINDAIKYSLDGVVYLALMSGESIFLPANCTNIKLMTNLANTSYRIIIWG
ncbi:MAG TPA: hypothetical protein VI911_12015 [Patescibacteria group bacterium]|nr:hypothetical protein [Patescibacteria group bacterium]